MRWNPKNGFVLYDMLDKTYNPQGWPESYGQFDTTVDDMLIATIITNPANVPAIYPLANKTYLSTAWGSYQWKSSVNNSNAPFWTYPRWRLPSTIGQEFRWFPGMEYPDGT